MTNLEWALFAVAALVIAVLFVFPGLVIVAATKVYRLISRLDRRSERSQP